MLLTQMLRDMRKSGEWEDEESQDTLGAETMYETLDVELAGHLAKVQGLGLSKQLLEAFDRMNGSRAPASRRPESSRPQCLRRRAAPSRDRRAAMKSARVAKLERCAEPRRCRGRRASEPDVAPVEGKVTSSFGWRHDPFTGQAKFHKGVDLRAAYGQDVKRGRRRPGRVQRHAGRLRHDGHG